MQTILVVLQLTFGLFLDVLSWLMVARAIISWLPDLSVSALGDFLYTLTEWFVQPVRAIFDKVGWAQNMVFDMPFFVTFIVITVVSSLL